MAGTQYWGTARIGPSQSVSYTGSAGTTSAVGAETFKVRVVVTTDAFVTTDGSTPSSSNGAYVIGLDPEYFTCTPGQVVKAVQVASAGTLYITECV